MVIEGRWLEIKPDKHEAWNNMGIAYYELKDYTQAIACYKKAVEIKPDYEFAWNNMGNAYIKFGKIEKAEEALRKAILFGGKAMPNMNLGHVYLAKGDRSEVMQHYKKGLEAFDDKQKYLNGMADDFTNLNLPQYGITKEAYDDVIASLRRLLPQQ